MRAAAVAAQDRLDEREEEFVFVLVVAVHGDGAAFAAHEIGPYVDMLAKRIASFPAPAVRLVKRAVDASALPVAEGLAEESYLFQQLMREPTAHVAMAQFLKQGGQTREAELGVDELAGRLNG